jgi:hypothetical protein
MLYLDISNIPVLGIAASRLRGLSRAYLSNTGPDPQMLIQLIGHLERWQMLKPTS